MAVTQTAQACDLVIFGAKGDLARRKLLPSLYQLEKAGQMRIQRQRRQILNILDVNGHLTDIPFTGFRPPAVAINPGHQ